MNTEKTTGFCLGEDVELNISLTSDKHLTMDEYDFYVEIYCYGNKRITFQKSELFRSDANTYIAAFNTDDIGAGRIRVKIYAFIPNTHFPNGLKKEIISIDTCIPINKV